MLSPSRRLSIIIAIRTLEAVALKSCIQTIILLQRFFWQIFSLGLCPRCWSFVSVIVISTSFFFPIVLDTSMFVIRTIGLHFKSETFLLPLNSESTIPFHSILELVSDLSYRIFFHFYEVSNGTVSSSPGLHNSQKLTDLVIKGIIHHRVHLTPREQPTLPSNCNELCGNTWP